MSSYPDELNHMLNAWNERDPGKVRAHLDLALAEDVRFSDPNIEVHGIDQFEQMIHEFRREHPNAVCSRTSDIDMHHRLCRYHWAIHDGDQLLLPGFDVVETEESGRVSLVLGFFGPLVPSSS